MCRVMARKNNGRQVLSHRDIAIASGISRSYVAKISTRNTWSGIRVDFIERFANACGVDVLKPSKVKQYWSVSKAYHIKHASKPHRMMFAKIFKQRPVAEAQG